MPPFACSATPGVPELLAMLRCSLVLSTYQAGKVIMLSSTGEGLIQLPRTFDKPMGLALDGDRMAVATRNELVMLVNAPSLAPGYPANPKTYDALFVPRAIYFTGEIDLHDMAWQDDTLWAINSRFSCLCHIDARYSFTPVWQPPFISDLLPEDRCHLNGMAMQDGAPRYVTALGKSDEPKGYRPHKVDGGILMHVPSGEILLSGLAMPHSPRVYDGQLYVLLSAAGELAAADPNTGRLETLARMPGFVRGLARYQDYLFIGMSKLRPGRPLGDIPLAHQELSSGIAIFQLSSGKVVGLISYQSSCEEIYDVHVLPGLVRPGIMGPDQPLHRSALFTPDYGFWPEPAHPGEA